MEEQASNKNLHDNDSPLQALTEFTNSFEDIASQMRWVQPAPTGPIAIDFDLIEQSATIMVTYESYRSLQDTIDCGEDPRDIDPHNIELHDLEELDREFEGTGDWMSNAYVTKRNYTDLWRVYRELWDQTKMMKDAFYKMANQWSVIGDIIQERDARNEGGEA